MRAIALSLLMMWSLPAFSAVSGQEITGFAMSTGTEAFQMKVSAPRAYISSIDQLLAAENVTLVVKQGGREVRATCTSFSHHLGHELATCDDRDSRTSFTIDMKNEKVTYYSAS